MYYEEKEINGILCFRTLPNTKFVEFTKEELTKRINKQKLEIYALQDKRHTATNNLNDYIRNCTMGYFK